MDEKIIVIGAGVTGVFAVTKLIKKGYPGNKITIIDIGKDPYRRQPEEVMHGFLGAGAWSDGKLVYKNNQIGGHLSKYCGEAKADLLVSEVVEMIKIFHPEPDKIGFSNPIEEPDFIKPYFSLRMAPTWHIGTSYLHKMGKIWYDWLIEKGVTFLWKHQVINVDFNRNIIFLKDNNSEEHFLYYDRLIYATGKSGIDLTEKIIKNNGIETEPKPLQIGVRFEAPQHYFQKILDISYDFKLYQDFDEISIRSFCTNSNSAYIAEENTYEMITYNGHSTGREEDRNNMVNFGIIMSIKDINNPFKYGLELVKRGQINLRGVFYSPKRNNSLTSEGKPVKCHCVRDLDIFIKTYGKYSTYILNYISDLNKIFKFGDDYSFYFPEIKFLSDEVLVNYDDLSLKQYPNVHFGGDSLSSRGISVSAAQGLYIAESILRK